MPYCCNPSAVSVPIHFRQNVHICANAHTRKQLDARFLSSSACPILIHSAAGGANIHHCEGSIAY